MAGYAALAARNLNEPLAPPLYPVSKNDKGAYALLIAVIMITITGIAICIKLQITFSTFRKLRRDDHSLIAALVFAVGYTVCVCRAVHWGFGREGSESTDTEIRNLSQYYYASNILLYIALASAKCSIAMLIIALKPIRWIAIALYGIMGLSLLWGVASIFTVALQCSPNRWVLGPTASDTCFDQAAAQIGIKAVDMATDVALAVLPAFMMLNVQVSLEKRLVVVLMFGLRLVTVIFTAVTLVRLVHFYGLPTSERYFAVTYPSIWTTAALNTSLLTACLPSIKRFLTDWAVGMTNAPIMEPFESSNNRSNGNYGQSSGIRTFGRSQQQRSKQGSKIDRETEIYHSRNGRDDKALSDDTESKRGLTDAIMRTVDYQVEYDDDQHGPYTRGASPQMRDDMYR